ASGTAAAGGSPWRGGHDESRRYFSVRYARGYVLRNNSFCASETLKRGQERMIGEPVVETLVRDSGSITAAERWLVNLLDLWRDTEAVRQGYGPGNVLNLLRLLRSNLNGRDILEPVTPGAGCISGSYLDPLPR